MGFVRIMFLISALCLETRKECRPIKALLLCDLEKADDIDTGQQLHVSLMVEVIVKLYAKLPSGSDFKVVLFGEHTFTFANLLNNVDKNIHVTFRDLISTMAIEEEMYTFFTVSDCRQNAEITYILTGNETQEYELPHIMMYEKKLMIIVFGKEGKAMEYFEWASSSRHVFHISNDADRANQYIFDLSCQDSHLVCDRNKYNEGWFIIRCQDCSNVCSRAVPGLCYSRCPYIKYTKSITDSLAATYESYIKFQIIEREFDTWLWSVTTITIIIVLLLFVIQMSKNRNAELRPDDVDRFNNVWLHVDTFKGPETLIHSREFKKYERLRDMISTKNEDRKYKTVFGKYIDIGRRDAAVFFDILDSEDVKQFTFNSDWITHLIIGFNHNNPFAPDHPFYPKMIDNIASMLNRSSTHLKTLVFSRLTIGEKQISNLVLLKKDIEDISKCIKEKKDVAQLCSRIIGRHITENNVEFDLGDFLSECSFVKYSSFADSIILNLICYDLAKSHRGIKEVYPALIKGENIPILVCFLEEEINLSRFRGFRLKTQMAYRLPAESTKLEDSVDKDSENYIHVVSENFRDINETLDFHSQKLVSKHSNIEAIGVSFLKFNVENEVEICPCIVIYCKLKSAIPYKESHFPRKLEHPRKFKSFQTDIRVGHFSLCPGGFASGRKGRYQEITMGCSIGESCTAYSASVGPFVNIVETNETCFLTVRHLFSLSRSDEEIIGKGIVQPADCDKVLTLSPEPDSTCGKVIALVLSEEVDAALVKISEERKPSRGLFSDITLGELANTGLSQTHVTTFDDGAQMDVDGLTLQSAYACRPILKVGSETGLTKGFLQTTSGVVKITDYKEKLETTYNGRRESHCMTKLLFVESIAGNKLFCQPGDSGAGAFLLDSSIKLHCIGIVIGVLNNTLTVVTPIGAVLDAFKQKYPNVTLELKKFNLDAMDTQ